MQLRVSMKCVLFFLQGTYVRCCINFHMHLSDPQRGLPWPVNQVGQPFKTSYTLGTVKTLQSFPLDFAHPWTPLFIPPSSYVDFWQKWWVRRVRGKQNAHFVAQDNARKLHSPLPSSAVCIIFPLTLDCHRPRPLSREWGLYRVTNLVGINLQFT